MGCLPQIHVPEPCRQLLAGGFDFRAQRHHFDRFLTLRWRETLPSGPLYSLLPLSISARFVAERLSPRLMGLVRGFAGWLRERVEASPQATAEQLLGAGAQRLDLDLLMKEARAFAQEPLFARPDLTIAADGSVSILELNIGSGHVGMFEYEQYLGLVESCPELRAACREAGLVLRSPWAAMAGVFDELDVGTLALVDFGEPANRTPAMAEYLNRYRRRGKTLYAYSAEAAYGDADGLTVDGCRVDGIYVNMAPRHYRSPHMAAYWEAVKAGKARSFSSQFATLLSSKAGLAMLHALDPRHELGALARELVPPTVALVATKAVWQGRDVDVPAFARANRRELVLKKASSEASFDVILGPSATDGEWDAAIGAALVSPDRYVLQAFLKPDTVDHYYFDDRTGRPEAITSHAVYSPYVVDGIVCLGARLSAAPVYDRPLVAPALGDCSIASVGFRTD